MKAALISLIVFLVGSLATSGYLLMEQKNSSTIIKGSQNEIKDLKEKTLAASESKIQAEKQILNLKHDLDNASKQGANMTNQLAAVKAALSARDDAVMAAQVQAAKLMVQLAEAEADTQALEKKSIQIHKESDTFRALVDNQRDTIARREAELKAVTEKLKRFSAAGLTPEEINTLKQKRSAGLTPDEANTLKQKRSVEIEFLGILQEKLIRPGKITKPLQNIEKPIPYEK